MFYIYGITEGGLRWYRGREERDGTATGLKKKFESNWLRTSENKSLLDRLRKVRKRKSWKGVMMAKNLRRLDFNSHAKIVCCDSKNNTANIAWLQETSEQKETEKQRLRHSLWVFAGSSDARGCRYSRWHWLLHPPPPGCICRTAHQSSWFPVKIKRMQPKNMPFITLRLV